MYLTRSSRNYCLPFCCELGIIKNENRIIFIERLKISRLIFRGKNLEIGVMTLGDEIIIWRFAKFLRFSLKFQKRITQPKNLKSEIFHIS